MSTDNAIKQKVQKWILTASALILIAKFAAYFITGSVGIFTDAMESIVNVAAGAISLYSLIQAGRPRDKEHPYGHGKIELLSASIEGILIMAAGAIIIYEAIGRLITPAEISKLDVGIWIVAVSGLFNFLLGSYSIHVGKKNKSIALIAGGKHLQSDTWSSVGLVLGLLILYFTGIVWLDSVIALIFGGVIIYTGISILRNTFSNLIDAADETLLTTMAKTINDQRKNDWIDVHNMKIIKNGNVLIIDCDLTMPWYYNIKQSHDTCESLELTLSEAFPDNLYISVHSDPCKEDQCSSCLMSDCTHRKHRFTGAKDLDMKQIIYCEEEHHFREKS